MPSFCRWRDHPGAANHPRPRHLGRCGGYYECAGLCCMSPVALHTCFSCSIFAFAQGECDRNKSPGGTGGWKETRIRFILSRGRKSLRETTSPGNTAPAPAFSPPPPPSVGTTPSPAPPPGQIAHEYAPCTSGEPKRSNGKLQMIHCVLVWHLQSNKKCS